MGTYIGAGVCCAAKRTPGRHTDVASFVRKLGVGSPGTVWGGQHLQLEMTASGANLDFDCANGTISGAPVSDATREVQDNENTRARASGTDDARRESLGAGAVRRNNSRRHDESGREHGRIHRALWGMRAHPR